MNRFLTLALMGLMLTACGPDEVPPPDPMDVADDDDTSAPDPLDVDDDEDGLSENEGDCDDTDPNVGAATPWYPDVDSDGYGDNEGIVTECEAPSGFVDNGDDCDDAHASIHPGAPEVCDHVDQDCDGELDNATGNMWYLDYDFDAYGGDIGVVNGCELATNALEQWVNNTDDCDDEDATINPAATEVCDSIDNDCDGDVDDDDGNVDTSTGSEFYLDADSDGEGDSASTTQACLVPDGYTSDSSDCDDGNSAVNTSATEYCDLVDNNCDGNVDEGVENTYYADADADGYGNASSTTLACTQPSGYVSDSTDCDDAEASANPGQTEVCDLIDNDCDGSVDEGVETTWFFDNDGDGEGDSASTTEACSAPSGYVSNSDDCDDADSGINTSATEVCDFVDNDCDGDVDDDDVGLDLATATEWYDDVDGDLYGDDTAPTLIQCSQPSGYEATGGDCDDTNSASYPGAPESCDGEDNDCDGSTDENLFTNWYLDDDGDLYGAGSPVTVICNGSSATLVDNDGDCDDTDFFVNPGVVEDPTNGIDDDCDGTID